MPNSSVKPTARLKANRPAPAQPQSVPPVDNTEHARNAASLLLHKHGEMAPHVINQHIGELHKKALSNPKAAAALAVAQHVRHFLEPQDEDFAQVQSHMGSGPSAMIRETPERFAADATTIPQKPAQPTNVASNGPTRLSHIPLVHHAELAKANHGDQVHAKLQTAHDHFAGLAAAGQHDANRPLLAAKALIGHLGGTTEARPSQPTPHHLGGKSHVDPNAATSPPTSNMVHGGEHALPSIPHDPVLDSYFHDDPNATALTEGEDVWRQPVRKGRNGAFHVHFDNDSRGVWKPAAMDQTQALRYHVPAGNPHGHEAAAWETAKHLGIDAVPTTISREMDRPNLPGAKETGSVQNFVDAMPAELSANAYTDPDLPKHAAFDHVIGNTDRHTNNWMVDGNGRSKLIDHGLAFPDREGPRVSQLYRHAVENNLPIPKEVSEWADKWPQIERSLKRHNLTKHQIGNVSARLQEIADAARKGRTFAELHAYNDADIAGLHRAIPAPESNHNF